MLFFKSTQKKEIVQAQRLLRHGKKVYAYRWDVLSEADREALKAAIETLKNLLKRKEQDEPLLRSASEVLQKILKKTGGTFYPVKFIPENTEVFLVAAILAIGIRTFFFQPFVIPTNSMYPTYYGMTPYVYTEASEPPNFLKRVWRMVTLGASHYNLKAKTGGDVKIPIVERGIAQRGFIQYKIVQGRKWFGLLPDQKREYAFFVNGELHRIRVPYDFPLDKVIVETFFAKSGSMSELFRSVMSGDGDNVEVTPHGVYLKTSKYVKRGDSIVNFDILLGDVLLVDRMRYHFCKPRVGDPFVFAVDSTVDRMKTWDPGKFFIKRLVGEGGDELKVEPPVLYRNGRPIEGSEAFKLNAERVGKYPGYTAYGALEGGKSVLIPVGYFYGMGDNSPESGDSRMFGPIPAESAIGKPFFIFYPFTQRWGLAK